MKRLVPLAAFMFVSTAAFAGGVTDRAGLFSDSAKSQAMSQIQSIENSTHEDVTVDVYNRAPAKAFASWAINHAPPTGGIYVVVSRNPGHVEVVVSNSSHFSSSDRQRIADIMLANFRKHDFDGGLTKSLAYAASLVPAPQVASAPSYSAPAQAAAPVAAAPAPAPAKKGVHWFWWFLLVPLVGWGLYKMVKSLGATPAEAENDTEAKPGGRPVSFDDGITMKMTTMKNRSGVERTTPPPAQAAAPNPDAVSPPDTSAPAPNPEPVAEPATNPAPTASATPPAREHRRSSRRSNQQVVVNVNSQPQTSSGSGFAAGVATGVALDGVGLAAGLATGIALDSMERDAEDRRRRQRDEDERRAAARREDERRRRKEEEEEEERRRRRDDDSSSSSSSWDSGSSGGSFDSDSSGGGFDSGSSGGGFDGGSSGGDF